MKHQKLVVFGASGKIGSELLQLLSAAKINTIAVTRDLSRAKHLPYIQWMQADMADRDSIAVVLQGCNAVFLLSAIGPLFVNDQNNVIHAAKKAGVNHIVKLSSGAADPASVLYIPQVHGKVETYLKASGLHWTMLQPNGMMQNWLGDLAESVRTERRFYEAVADGKRAHVDIRDIAEVAFNCLTFPHKHLEKSYLLTSDKAINYYDVARMVSQAIRETVTYIPISLAEAKSQMNAARIPPAIVETFLAYDMAQGQGRTEVVTNCIETILGKPPRTAEAFIAEFATQFI